MKREPKPKKHQRRIQFSVTMPATVELIVGTDDDAPSTDSDWEILSVISARCEATPRTVEESLDDFESLAAAAANAEDLR